MDTNTKQQVEQRLRDQWSQVSVNILNRFSQVCRADLDSATSVDDLVRRIEDKTGYSGQLIEENISELAGVGARGADYPQGTPFGREQHFGQSGTAQR